jgi:hypothetical protein
LGSVSALGERQRLGERQQLEVCQRLGESQRLGECWRLGERQRLGEHQRLGELWRLGERQRSTNLENINIGCQVWILLEEQVPWILGAVNGLSQLLVLHVLPNLLVLMMYRKLSLLIIENSAIFWAIELSVFVAKIIDNSR